MKQVIADLDNDWRITGEEIDDYVRKVGAAASAA